jgi:hypothetical protein
VRNYPRLHTDTHGSPFNLSRRKGVAPKQRIESRSADQLEHPSTVQSSPNRTQKQSESSPRDRQSKRREKVKTRTGSRTPPDVRQVFRFSFVIDPSPFTNHRWPASSSQKLSMTFLDGFTSVPAETQSDAGPFGAILFVRICVPSVDPRPVVIWREDPSPGMVPTDEPQGAVITAEFSVNQPGQRQKVWPIQQSSSEWQSNETLIMTN